MPATIPNERALIQRLKTLSGVQETVVQELCYQPPSAPPPPPPKFTLARAGERCIQGYETVRTMSARGTTGVVSLSPKPEFQSTRTDPNLDGPFAYMYEP